MANPYFRFKQFTVYQNDCPLKVCTDACLFGAWVTHYLPAGFAETILDVGTGTGLISLMLAQSTSGLIDAVEINQVAARQAAVNFNQSPWSKRLRIHEVDFIDFISAKPFGLIISNPPFFEQSLRSTDEAKNAAKHDSTLQLSTLIEKAATHLSAIGQLALLLPWSRQEEAINLAEKQSLYLQRQVAVRPHPEKDFFRSMLLFSKKRADNQCENITIRLRENEYSPEFITLLRPYYLNL